MKFEHKEIPEHINVTRVHPLRELTVLLGGALLLIILLVYLFGLSAGFLARYIPFETELKLASSFPEEVHDDNEIYAYLSEVKDKVVEAMELPRDITITLRYSNSDTVNAFATLGGNVVVFRGILEKLPNENALAMLLAHEIAHIKHRDPIVSASRGITTSAILALILGQSDTAVLSNIGLYSMLHFSREMEREADKEALQTTYKIYGHTNGADDLFQIIQTVHSESGQGTGIEFLQSHPLDQNRINALHALADKNHWLTEGEAKPIPQSFFDALKEHDQSNAKNNDV